MVVPAQVGDDVVFGSRSAIIAGDARENRPIRLEAGAMVGGEEKE